MPIGNDSIGALIERRADFKRRDDSLTTALEAESAAGERADLGRSVAERLRIINTDSALHAGNSGAMFNYLSVGEGENRGGAGLTMLG